MKQNNILHLVLKGYWYDKIASGEKTSEYRECKPYWDDRIIRFWNTNRFNKPTVVFHKGYTSETIKFEIKVIYKTFETNDLGVSPVYEIQLGKRIA